MSAVSQTDKLARMANQIATFFRSYPEEEAVAGVQKHITAFWTPRMIDRLKEGLPELDGRIDVLVVRALEGGRARAESPVRAATHDPHLLGAGASDAG